MVGWTVITMPNYEIKPLPDDLTEDEYFYLLTLEFRHQQYNYQMMDNNLRDSKRMALNNLEVKDKGLKKYLLYTKYDHCILCWCHPNCEGCPAAERKNGGDGFCDFATENLWAIDDPLLWEQGIQNLEVVDRKATRLRAVIRNRRK